MDVVWLTVGKETYGGTLITISIVPTDWKDYKWYEHMVIGTDRRNKKYMSLFYILEHFKQILSFKDLILVELKQKQKILTPYSNDFKKS